MGIALEDSWRGTTLGMLRSWPILHKDARNSPTGSWYLIMRHQPVSKMNPGSAHRLTCSTLNWLLISVRWSHRVEILAKNMAKFPDTRLRNQSEVGCPHSSLAQLGFKSQVHLICRKKVVLPISQSLKKLWLVVICICGVIVKYLFNTYFMGHALF